MRLMEGAVVGCMGGWGIGRGSSHSVVSEALDSGGWMDGWVCFLLGLHRAMAVMTYEQYLDALWEKRTNVLELVLESAKGS